MLHILISAVVAATLILTYSQIRGYRRYKAEAEQTGFKYFVAPFHFQSVPWMLLQDTLVPLLRKLPDSWTKNWLPLSLWFKVWHVGYQPFANAGEDTIVIASPKGNVLWTCEPEVIDQITARRHDFIKTIEMLQLLNLYGPTFTVSEGEEHAKFRKLAKPTFSEHTNREVWTESIEQIEQMMEGITAQNGRSDELNVDTAKHALHILSKIFHHKTMSWSDNDSAPAGHQLSYGKAISDAFKYAATLFMIPKPILAVSPVEIHKKAYLAFSEFKQFMQEMKVETEQRLEKARAVSGEKADTTDGTSLLDNFVKAGMPSYATDNDVLLPPEAVYGNLFIFILAGLETSANTLANAIVLLACNQEFQKSLQKEVDAVFGYGGSTAKGADISSKMLDEYANTFQTLWHGHIGALMKETLRLYAPVPFIPKINEETQTITLSDGKKHVIPPETLLFINTAALHRNPKYWPESSISSAPSLSEFHPDRWLDTASPDIKHDPSKFSYLPFSEGFRSCFGTRFAQVEFCAAVARIFAEWKVELADSSPAGLEEAKKCMSEHISFELGLKMGRNVPLKFTRRQN